MIIPDHLIRTIVILTIVYIVGQYFYDFCRSREIAISELLKRYVESYIHVLIAVSKNYFTVFVSSF